VSSTRRGDWCLDEAGGEGHCWQCDDDEDTASLKLKNEGRSRRGRQITVRISPIDAKCQSGSCEICVDHRNDTDEQIKDTLGQCLNACKATEADKRQKETILYQILTILADRQSPKVS
jgi:hypothetical protein